MTVETDEFKILPILVYKNLHFTLMQFMQSDEGVKSVKTKAKYYALQDAGLSTETKHMDNSPEAVVEANSANFDAEVLQYAVVNGFATDLSDGVAKYAAAKAAIQADYEAGNITPFDIMAFYELGMAFHLKMQGKINTINIG